MAIKTIFAQKDSEIDLSSLGNKNQVEITRSGLDLVFKSGEDKVIIVKGALYSVVTESKLVITLKDGPLPLKKWIGKIKETEEKEQEEQEKQKEENNQEEEKIQEAEKNKIIKQEMDAIVQELKTTEKKVDEHLKQEKAKRPKNAEDESPALRADKLVERSDVKTEKISTDANRSGEQTNPVLPPKPDLKTTLYLDKDSNSSGQDDNLTRETLPKLIGHTISGATVFIQHNGVFLGSTVADPSGYFTFTPTKKLPDGHHKFVASVNNGNHTDNAGLQLEIKSRTDLPSFDVVPADIAFEGEDKDTFLIKNPTASIYGTAEPGTGISILVDGKLVGGVKVDARGQWEYHFKGNTLSQGKNNIEVIAQDTAKNTEKVTKVIDLDAVPPAIPTIELSADAQTNAKNLQVTRLLKPGFKGTAEPGSKMELWLDGEKIEKTILADEKGNWSFSPDTDLASGPHHIKIEAIDNRRNRSSPREYDIEIDNNIGQFHARIKDADNSSREIEGQDLQITNNKRPGFEGSGKPGSHITVSNPRTGTKNHIEVDEHGRWILDNMDSEIGDNQLIFDIKDLSGNEGQHILNYVIKTTPPAPPSDISLKDSVDILFIDGVQTSKNTKPTIKGRGEPGIGILIYEDENALAPLARVPVNRHGDWSHTFSEPLDSRAHKMTFRAQDVANNVSEEAFFGFHIQTENHILEAYLTQGSRSGKGTEKWKTQKTEDLVLEGKADPHARVTMTIEGKEPLTTYTDNNGDGSIALPWSLGKGHYGVNILSINELKLPLNKDYSLTIKPGMNAPEIEMVNDDSVQKQHHQVVTSKDKPAFIIRGDGGSQMTVMFYDEEENLYYQETLEMPPSGELEFKMNQALPDGKYQVQVELKDDIGNESSMAEKYDFEIRPTDQPTIALENGTSLDEKEETLTNEQTLVLKGTAEPGSIIHLYQNGHKILNDTVIKTDQYGKWRAEVPVEKEGQYDFHIVSHNMTRESHSHTLTVRVDRSVEIYKIELQESDIKAGSENKNITERKKPGFSVTVPEDVQEITLFINGKALKFNLIKGPPENGQVIWTCTLEEDLRPDKQYELNVRVVDHANNTTDKSYSFFTTSDREPPSIRLEDNSKTGSSANMTHQQQPEFILDNIKVIEGLDLPIVKVLIKDKNTDVVIQTLYGGYDPEKGWTAKASKNVDPGNYDIHVEVTAADKQTTQSTFPFSLTVKTEVAAPEVRLVSGTQDDDKSYTNDPRPKFEIELKDNQIESVTVNIIDKNGKIVSTGQLDVSAESVNGNYDYRPDFSIENGDYTVRVEVKDVAGNPNNTSLSLNINDGKPNQPSIDLDSESDDSRIKNRKNEKWTQKKQPRFNINLNEDDTNSVQKVWVTIISEDGKQIGPVEVQTEGSNTFFIPENTLDNGQYILFVQTQNPAGTWSKPSEKRVVHVDHSKPELPGIIHNDLIESGGIFYISNKNSKFLLTNIDPQSDLDAIKVIFIGDSVPVDGKVFKDGANFYVEMPDHFNDGKYKMTVVVEDNASHKSDQGQLEFTLDTSEPEAPKITFDAHHFITDPDGKEVAKNQRPTFYFDVEQDVKKEQLKIEMNGEDIKGILEKVQGSTTGWRFIPEVNLKNGNDYQFSVTLSSPSGNNKSSASKAFRTLPEPGKTTIEMIDSTSLDKNHYPYFTSKNPVRFKLLPSGDAKDIHKIWVSLSGNDDDWHEVPASGQDWIYQTDVLSEGRHTLYVKAKDIAGKATTSKQIFETRTHLDAPEVELSGKDNAVSGKSQNNKKFTSNQNPQFIFQNVPDDIYQMIIKIEGQRQYQIDRKDLQRYGENAVLWNSPDDFDLGEHSITVQYISIAGTESDPFSLLLSVLKAGAPESPRMVFNDETDTDIKGDRVTRAQNPLVDIYTHFGSHATVKLFIDGHPIETRNVDTYGKTSFDLTEILKESRTYNVRVEIEYPDHSGHELSHALVINRDPPEKPSNITVENIDNAIVIKGEVKEAQKIKVKIGDDFSSEIVLKDNKFSFTLPKEHLEKPVSITAIKDGVSSDPYELKGIVAITDIEFHVDGDSFKAKGHTSPNTKVNITNKKGKKVGEGLTDKNGKFDIEITDFENFMREALTFSIDNNDYLSLPTINTLDNLIFFWADYSKNEVYLLMSTSEKAKLEGDINFYADGGWRDINGIFLNETRNGIDLYYTEYEASRLEIYINYLNSFSTKMVLKFYKTNNEAKVLSYEGGGSCTVMQMPNGLYEKIKNQVSPKRNKRSVDDDQDEHRSLDEDKEHEKQPASSKDKADKPHSALPGTRDSDSENPLKPTVVSIKNLVEEHPNVTKNNKSLILINAQDDMQDAIKAVVALDGIDYPVDLKDGKGQLMVETPLPEGTYDLQVQLINQKNESMTINEKIKIDFSSNDIVKSMEPRHHHTTEPSNTDAFKPKTDTILPILYIYSPEDHDEFTINE